MEKKSRHKKWVKRTGFVLIGIVLVLSVVISVFLFKLEDIAGNQLKKFVSLQTNQTYRLEYDSLSIDFNLKQFSAFLEIDQFRLFPDSSVQMATGKQPLHLEAASLSVSGIRLGDIFKNHEINALSFEISSPYAEIGQDNPFQINNLNARTITVGDSVFLPFFKKIAIDTVRVLNALIDIDSLIYLPPDSKLPVVNLEAIGFSVGGLKTTPTPYPFDVHDLFLKIESIDHMLPDGLHHLHAGEFSLSLINRSMYLQNLELNPIDPAVITTRNLYRARVPRVKIESRQVETLMSADTVHIEYVEFEDPEIEIKFGKNAGKGTPLNQLNFYQFIENDIEWAQIDTFVIKDGRLTLVPNHTEKTGQEFDQLNIHFNQFRVDPGSYRDPNRILSARSVQLEIGQLTINHTDEIHQLKIKQLAIDTRQKTFSTGAVSFKPIEGTRIDSTGTLMDVVAQKLKFNGFSFAEVYHRQIFPMNRLLIDRPEVKLWVKTRPDEATSTRDRSLILEKVSPYIKGIYVNNALISKGRIEYGFQNISGKKGSFSTRFDFNLKGLSVDSITFYKSDKFFFARDFDLSFTKVNLDLTDRIHRLETDSLSLSSLGQTAEVFNFRLHPVHPDADSIIKANQSTGFDLRLPHVSLSGAGFHKAFFEKTLEIDRFMIDQPRLKLQKFGKWTSDQDRTSTGENDFYGLFSDFLSRISVHNLTMKEGEMDYVQYLDNKRTIDLTNQFSVTLINFELDSLSPTRTDKLFYSDWIDLSLKDQTFDMADGIHRLEAHEVAILSGQKRLFIRDAKLYPNMNSEAFKSAPLSFKATIPLIQADGVKIIDILTKGQIPVDRLLFVKPVIELIVQTKVSPGRSDSIQKPLIIPKTLNEMMIGKVIIEKGDLRLTRFENGRFEPFAGSLIDFSLDRLRIEKQGDSFSTRYDDFSLSVDDARYTLPDRRHELSVSHFDYQLSNSNLNITGLHITPDKAQPKSGPSGSFDILIPFISLKSIDIERLTQFRELRAAELTVTNPMITIVQEQQKEKKPFNPYHLELERLLSKEFRSIRLDQVALLNVDLQIEDKQVTVFKKMNLKGKGFSLNEQSGINQKLFYCNEINWTIGQLSGKTSDGLYRYSIGQIEADHTGRVLVSDIEFKPIPDRDAFFSKKRYQDDYWQIELPKAEVLGVDFKAFIEQKIFSGRRLNLDFSKVEIFREKRLPLDPAKQTKLPQQALRELNHQFKLDTLALHCPKLTYREWELNALRESSVYFSDVSALATNLTNRPQLISRNPNMTLNIDGLLMGEGVLQVRSRFDMKSDRNRFDLEAHCGPMALYQLNPILEPGTKLSIREGICRDLQVSFVAEEDSSVGTLALAYDGLKVALLSTKQGAVKEDKLASFLINHLALKDQNPKPGKEIQPEAFEYHRDKRYSVVNYIWKSIFAGLKETFGLKEKEPAPTPKDQ